MAVAAPIARRSRSPKWSKCQFEPARRFSDWRGRSRFLPLGRELFTDFTGELGDTWLLDTALNHFKYPALKHREDDFRVRRSVYGFKPVLNAKAVKLSQQGLLIITEAFIHVASRIEIHPRLP